MRKGRDIVLVAGATGLRGGAVARELLICGVRVRALAGKSDSDAARDLVRHGIEVVEGDLDDPRSLEQALRGAYGVFSVQGAAHAGAEREQAQGIRFAELARQAGVHQFVYCSAHFEHRRRVEEAVRDLGFTCWTVLRPVFFMENWLSPRFRPALDQGTLTIGLKPATRLQMLAVEDLGKYAARSFEEAERFNRAEIDLAGDAKTMPEVAQVLSLALGHPIEFVPAAIAEEWTERVGPAVEIPNLSKRWGHRPLSFTLWVAKQRWTTVPA